MPNFLVSGPKFARLFSRKAGIIVLNNNHVFSILDILTCAGDIHDKSLKFYKTAQNLACFSHQIFGGQHPNFGTCIIPRYLSWGKVSRWSAVAAWRSCGKI